LYFRFVQYENIFQENIFLFTDNSNSYLTSLNEKLRESQKEINSFLTSYIESLKTGSGEEATANGSGLLDEDDGEDDDDDDDDDDVAHEPDEKRAKTEVV
jgi:hypothetical protein